MDFKVPILDAQPPVIPVIDSRFVTNSQTTLSFAENTPTHGLVYANKQLRDESDAVIATLSRDIKCCSIKETFPVTSPYLAQPAAIINTSGWSCSTMTHTWKLSDDMTLAIAGPYFSSAAEVILTLPTSEKIVVGTLGSKNTVTLAPGVDAAAVLLMCRTWSHSQKDLCVATVMAWFPPSALALTYAVNTIWMYIILLVLMVLDLGFLFYWVMRFRG
ncbi:hypothetical protein ACHHYP_09571 [Achlya hypogyna]|uniref:Uncharacterized protein n=1 Tax=Achlya hypogyna TaxID=1202772 RepID=A0A1V9YN26_ACHHY|nr:hypothetical protein ACHHYP_09571 [Achlya hypogyna]